MFTTRPPSGTRVEPHAKKRQKTLFDMSRTKRSARRAMARILGTEGGYIYRQVANAIAARPAPLPLQAAEGKAEAGAEAQRRMLLKGRAGARESRDK
eukprot:1158673-Pelagomonas_calceolata.AAC.3